MARTEHFAREQSPETVQLMYANKTYTNQSEVVWYQMIICIIDDRSIVSVNNLERANIISYEEKLKIQMECHTPPES